VSVTRLLRLAFAIAALKYVPLLFVGKPTRPAADKVLLCDWRSFAEDAGASWSYGLGIRLIRHPSQASAVLPPNLSGGARGVHYANLFDRVEHTTRNRAVRSPRRAGHDR
jgi:hypothetical protein